MASRLPLRFLGFEDPAHFLRVNETFSPAELLEHGKGEKAKRQMMPGEIARGTWIYVFEQSDSGWWLRYELLERGPSSPYQRVPWGASVGEAATFRSNHGGTTTRSATQSVERDRVIVDGGRDHYVIISEIQLPAHRIERYRTQPIGRQRGVFVPAGTPTDPKLKAAVVQAVDFMLFAKAFHAEYERSKQAWEATLSPLATKKRYLGQLVAELAGGSDEVKKQLRPGHAQTFVKQDAADVEKKQLAPYRAVFHLVSWMKLPGFEAMLRDYDGTEFIEKRVQEQYDKMLEGLVEQKVGLAYLENVAKDPESWLSRYFLSGAPFQMWRKSIAASDVFEDLLVKYYAGRAVHHFRVARRGSPDALKIAAKEMEKIVAAYASLRGLNLQDTFFSVQQEGNTYRISARSLPDLQEARRNLRVRHKVEALNVRTKKVLLAVELLNLAYSMEAMGKSLENGKAEEKVMNGIGLVGGIADSIAAAEFLLKQPGVADRIVASRVAGKTLSVLPFIGAFCDYAAGVVGAYKATEEGKAGLMIGNVATALAATALGASAAAGATGAAVFGLAAGPLLVVGVLLFVAGTAILWRYAEDPLAEWAASCPWGVDSRFKSPDPAGVTEREIDEQFGKLLDLLGTPRLDVQVQSKDDRSTVTTTLKAPVMLPDSHFVVDLHIDAMWAGAYQSAGPTREKDVVTRLFSVPTDAKVNVQRRQVVYTFTTNGKNLKTHTAPSSARILTYRAHVRARFVKTGEWRAFDLEGSVHAS